MKDELKTLEREAKEYLSDEICEATFNLCVLMAKRAARHGEASTEAEYIASISMRFGAQFTTNLTSKLADVGIEANFLIHNSVPTVHLTWHQGDEAREPKSPWELLAELMVEHG